MLTPEQKRVLKNNPELGATVVDFWQRYGRKAAERYLKRTVGASGEGKAIALLSSAEQRIVRLLESGPKTREQLIRAGVSRESIEKYLVSLQKKRRITAWRSPQGHPPIYALAQQEARA